MAAQSASETMPSSGMRISTKVLTERLRMLETAGLLLREQAPTIPPQVTYSLTDRGEELRAVMSSLTSVARRWDSEGWTPPPRQARPSFSNRASRSRAKSSPA